MNCELPNGFVLRGAMPDDAQAVTDLICLCDTADYGEPDYSIEDVRADWRRDGFELPRDAWLVYAQDGTLAAYGNAWEIGDVVRTEQTCVHPNFRGHGLEDFLIARAEEYTREIAVAKSVQWIMSVEQQETLKRFESRGYHTTRHDYVMEIVMSELPPLPLVPDGIVMRSFVRGQDERAVWVCIQEAFRDARGYTADYPFEPWMREFTEHADWSPETSTVVTQGDEVIAAAMTFNFSNGGWIRQLGVRRPWRKRGIGLAMLHRIFRDFYSRGVKIVGLGVDAESLTGATRLYERAGMSVKHHYVRYEKEIR